MPSKKLFVLSLVCAAVILLALSAEAQKPQPRTQVRHTNDGPPPSTWDSLWREAPLILRGEVIASRVRVAIPGSLTPHIVTEHRLRVSELFKQPDAMATPLTEVAVLQNAGTKEIDGTLFTTDPGEMPTYGRGDELLLFLAPWPEAGGYMIVHGAAGAYLINSGEVRIPERARHFAPTFAGRRVLPRDDFLAIVRSTVARGQFRR